MKVIPPRSLFETLDAISRHRAGLRSAGFSLDRDGAAWIERVKNQLAEAMDDAGLHAVTESLVPAMESLLKVTGSPQVNVLAGRVLTLMLEAERRITGSTAVMRRLLGPGVAHAAERNGKHLLVLNCGITSTTVASFIGIAKVREAVLHIPLDTEDTVETRSETVLGWLADEGINPTALDGIACRSGFIRPVPTGTYRLVPEMISDLENPRFRHASNMGVAIAMRLAEATGRPADILLTTSDPVVSDEINLVDRITGFVKIKRDGSGAHYLAQKSAQRLLASLADRETEDFNAVIAHLGRGISVAAIKNGRAVSVFDAFSGMPTTSRCGPLDLPRLLDGIEEDRFTMREVEAVTYERGGLLSLAGTDDFRTLEGFMSKGASPEQRRKIELIYEYFARKITSAILTLSTDCKPMDVVALTGGLANSEELVRRIREQVYGRFPLVLMPGSIESESLAAGLLRGWSEPGYLKDYVHERDKLAAVRQTEDKLLDTVIFDRRVIYRKKDAPIVTLDELIDATRITVKENFSPSIAIVGAANEEAILAAKRANEEGSYRIAKFDLVGDFAAINQIAYDFDLVIDNDNYRIHDTDDPVADAIRLLDAGQAHILMKGSMDTSTLLHGVFQYLKRSGRLEKGQLMSHVFVMDIPRRNKLLLISDAAVNTYPDEEKKIKILENTLIVARHLNIRKPKVAVISAIESVNPSVESSIEAEHIAERFADRTDCIVEGPLSFDVAMDQKIAIEKKYKKQIRGTADILIMPDIDAGNVLYKSLTTQTGATAAGVIMCGDLPLVLTSRGDSARSKLASISLAVKLFFDLKQDSERLQKEREGDTHGMENPAAAGSIQQPPDHS